MNHTALSIRVKVEKNLVPSQLTTFNKFTGKQIAIKMGEYESNYPILHNKIIFKDTGEPKILSGNIFLKKDLILNNEDLILLTGNYNNFFGKLFYANKLKLIEKLIVKLKSSFTDRLYIEIQRHGENQEVNYENYLLQLSSSSNLPIIAGQEVYYLDPNMAEAHDALICIGEKKFIDDKNRFRYSDQHYLKKNTELQRLYKDIPEALENNYNFPLRFNFKPKKSKPILPSISNNKNVTVETELMSQAKKGLEERLNNFF